MAKGANRPLPSERRQLIAVTRRIDSDVDQAGAVMRQGGGEGGFQRLVRPDFPAAAAQAERRRGKIHRRIAHADRPVLAPLLFEIDELTSW